MHDVLAIAEAIREPMVAVGHSSGGVVVLEAALADPSRFAGILLYEPAIAVTEPLGGEALRRARAARDGGDADRAVRLFLREIVGVPGPLVSALVWIRPVWRRLRDFAPAQIADTEAIESLGVGVERYRALVVPTFLLRGWLFSPGHVHPRLDALGEVLPRVVSDRVLRLSGHGAYYTAPDRVARLIDEFAGIVARG